MKLLSYRQKDQQIQSLKKTFGLAGLFVVESIISQCSCVRLDSLLPFRLHSRLVACHLS